MLVCVYGGGGATCHYSNSTVQESGKRWLLNSAFYKRITDATEKTEVQT